MDIIDNCTVVIRSVGERTEVLCEDIIKEQVNPQNVFLINEIPFSQAVRKTFELGLERNLPWTIAVDADVLIFRDGIRRLIEYAENQTNLFFKLNAKGFDKFYGKSRYICPHLYTTSLLEKALECPDTGVTLRPETAIVDFMLEKHKVGFIQYNREIAIHDFGQYYSDIYRKAFVHSKKHAPLNLNFVKYWGEMASRDNDFIVAMAGLFEGIYTSTEVKIDFDILPKNYGRSGFLCGLDEKKELNIGKETKKIKQLLHQLDHIASTQKIIPSFPIHKYLKNKIV